MHRQWKRCETILVISPQKYLGYCDKFGRLLTKRWMIFFATALPNGFMRNSCSSLHTHTHTFTTNANKQDCWCRANICMQRMRQLKRKGLASTLLNAIKADLSTHVTSRSRVELHSLLNQKKAKTTTTNTACEYCSTEHI